ncbi:hypothetical protein ABH899_003697 [Paenibacillus sp. RC84]
MLLLLFFHGVLPIVDASRDAAVKRIDLFMFLSFQDILVSNLHLLVNRLIVGLAGNREE